MLRYLFIFCMFLLTLKLFNVINLTYTECMVPLIIGYIFNVFLTLLLFLKIVFDY